AMPDSVVGDRADMLLGVCVIEAAAPYTKQLKKDFGLDLGNLDKYGDKLGELIGVRMVSICPDVIIKYSQKAEALEEEEAKEEAEEISGVVTKIEDNQFVTFWVKERSGKESRFYWFLFVNSDLDLPNN